MRYLLNKVVTSVPSHLTSHQDKWLLLTVSIVLYPDSIHCGIFIVVNRKCDLLQKINTNAFPFNG